MLPQVLALAVVFNYGRNAGRTLAFYQSENQVFDEKLFAVCNWIR